MENQSEVAKIRARIYLEVEALQRIKSEFAKVADHETIMHHYRMLDDCYKGLVIHVGSEMATDLVCDKMDTIK